MCRVYTVPLLPNRGDDSVQEMMVFLTVVFLRDPIDERQIRLVKPVDSLFERPAGEVGNNLKPGRNRADVDHAQGPDKLSDLALIDDILLRRSSLSLFLLALSFSHV